MGLPDQKLLCMLALETRCIAIKLKNIPALLQSIEQYGGSVTKLKTSKDVAPDRRTVNSSDSNTTTISAGSLHYIAMEEGGKMTFYGDHALYGCLPFLSPHRIR